MGAESNTITREFIPMILMDGLFIFIHGIALLSLGPLQAGGIEPAFENPNDPANLLYFFTIIIIVTAVILLIAKYWKKRVIQLIILGAVGYTTFYILFPLASLITTNLLSLIFSLAVALILIIALFKYPEWYVIDTAGILIGAGAIAIFGISLSIFLVILLLIILAIYDAISVYKTKHMIDLADTVMDLKLPVLLVIPKTQGYSLLKQKQSIKEKIKKGKKRDAFFMGLGDIVMPGILVAALYTTTNQLLLPITVIIGTLIGFTLLMTLVIKGKPQAGLPLLNGGAIAAYIIGSYSIYGTLIGLSLPL